MTKERYDYIENEIEKIRCSSLSDEEIAEEEMFLFENREEFDEWNDIHNGGVLKWKNI